MDARDQQRILRDWLTSHKGVLYKVVRAYAGSPADRDDLYQEIATQLWLSIPSFRGESRPSTWIYRVALFTAIAWSKSERKHRENHTSLDSTGEVASEPEDERVRWLYDQIRRLDPIDRSLILLHLEGFSYEDIAVMLGVLVSNVGVKLHRIKKRLTQQVQREHRNGI